MQRLRGWGRKTGQTEMTVKEPCLFGVYFKAFPLQSFPSVRFSTHPQQSGADMENAIPFSATRPGNTLAVDRSILLQQI